MKDNNDKRIAKIDNSLIQKISNQISITNKLLKGDFQYSNWWNDLDNNWQFFFRNNIELQIAVLDLKNALHKLDNPGNDSILSEEESHLISKYESGMDDIMIRYLLRMSSIFLSAEELIKLTDLKPLTVFVNLEEVKFANVEIKDISQLFYLENLRSITFANDIMKINKEQIEKFQQHKPKCKVISFIAKGNGNNK